MRRDQVHTPMASATPPTNVLFALALTVTLLSGRPAVADVFHLETGGSVEGELVRRAEGHYEIRTTVGIVRVPREAVVRVESKPTPFDEYADRLKEVADTPAAQLSLAEWCGEVGLEERAAEHYTRAIELDRDCESARRALGYVKVRGLWLDGRTRIARPPAPQEEADDDPEKLVRAIQSQWYRHVLAVRRALLESSLARQREAGVARIREISDPLAILPLTRVLSEGAPRLRMLLVEMLTRFPQDEATMNLAVLGLVDDDPDVRQAALRELERRDDPRVVAQYREALRSNSDLILKRAAEGLGHFDAEAAIPELIALLTAERVRWVEVPVRSYFRTLPRRFSEATVLRLGPHDAPIALHTPVIGVAGAATNIDNRWARRRVTVFRTEVLEALKSITGQNFGFDAGAWQGWYREFVQ